jgi:hypothetical protein
MDDVKVALQELKEEKDSSRLAASPYTCYGVAMRRTTIFLPEEMHERLRQDAFRARTSMAEMIRARLQRSLDRPRRRPAGPDPILKVAGVCRGPLLSSEIDDCLCRR